MFFSRRERSVARNRPPPGRSTKGAEMTRTHRIALVTGASRGLGLAVARLLAERGHHLVIDARGAADLERARAALAPLTRVVALPGDVADAGHRLALVDAAWRMGGLDALVNNAGILGPSPMPAVDRLAPADLERILLVNTVAPVALAQDALPLLEASPFGGRVVNVTSDAAVEGYPLWGGYGAGKAALEALSRSLAAERPDLRVHVVDPGDMRTRMHQEAFPGEDISDRPPPEESAPALVRLVEEDLPSGRWRAADLVAQGAAR